jgi:hypothetical protein
MLSDLIVQAIESQPSEMRLSPFLFRLAIIGLSKNVGKTTVVNHLLDVLPLPASELALTSLGLDGEALDALTGLPKPRIVPAPGLLVATAQRLLASSTAEVEALEELPGRTALGPVVLGRVRLPGRIEIAGPTLLSDLALTARRMPLHGARLLLIDGAINRLGAAAPEVSDACILCTGATVGATVQAVARRTVENLEKLSTPAASRELWAAFGALPPACRLAMLMPDGKIQTAPHETLEPDVAARWIAGQAQEGAQTCFLRGAFTDELAWALLRRWSSCWPLVCVLPDATRLFAAVALLRQLAERGVSLVVVQPTRVLAVTLSPFAPGTHLPTRQLAQAIQALCSRHPPLLDVVSGLFLPAAEN